MRHVRNGEMKRTVGDVPLCKENERFTSARGHHEGKSGTYEIGRGAEVYGIRIALVLFLKKGCEGSS